MKSRWLFAVLLAGIAYLVIGLVSADLAARAATHRGVVGWRLAAWLLSGVVFAAHIVHDQFRLRLPLLPTAWHAAAGAALGAFGLAVAMNIHSYSLASDHRTFQLRVWSLLLWPLITFVPALIAALVASAILRRLR